MKKPLIPILFLSLITLGLLFFIRKSNDHKECENVKTIEVLDDGTKIEKVTHFCKEKFNF